MSEALFSYPRVLERISMKNFTGSDIRELRKKLGLNQSQFLSLIHI